MCVYATEVAARLVRSITNHHVDYFICFHFFLLGRGGGRLVGFFFNWLHDIIIYFYVGAPTQSSMHLLLNILQTCS